MNGTDPHHLANNLLIKGLSPHLEGRIPPNLGREAFASIRRRLGADGLPGNLHAEEVFARALMNTIKSLNKNGGERVRNPRAWFLSTCRHETIAYMKELKPLVPLKVVLEGRRPLSEMPVLPHEEHVLEHPRTLTSAAGTH